MGRKKEHRLDNVAIRLVKEPPLYSTEPVDTPEKAVKLLSDVLSEYDREVFAIVMMQVDLKPIAVSIVSVGALSETLAHPREILKPIILANANAVLLAHNHVSGSLTPSSYDIETTDRMQKLCTMLGTPLLDHVIISRYNRFFSFKENDILPLGKTIYAERPEDIQFSVPAVAEKESVIEKLAEGKIASPGKNMNKTKQPRTETCR